MKTISLSLQSFFPKQYIDQLNKSLSNDSLLLPSELEYLGIRDPLDEIYLSKGYDNLPSEYVRKSKLIMFYDEVACMYFVSKNRYDITLGWHYPDEVRHLIDKEFACPIIK